MRHYIETPLSGRLFLHMLPNIHAELYRGELKRGFNPETHAVVQFVLPKGKLSGIQIVERFRIQQEKVK